jgi:hypothetical protein
MLAAYSPIDASGYEVYNNTIIANRVGVEVYSANNIHDNIINVPSGATLIKKAGTAAINQVNNIQVSGNPEQLKLDASFVPLPGSPAYRDSGDAGAIQAYRPPPPPVVVKYPGIIEVVETAGQIAVYAKYGDKSVLIYTGPDN